MIGKYCIIDLKAGAPTNHQVGDFENFAWRLPVGEVIKCIGSKYQHESLRVLLPNFTHAVDAVRRSVTLQLERIQYESSIRPDPGRPALRGAGRERRDPNRRARRAARDAAVMTGSGLVLRHFWYWQDKAAYRVFAGRLEDLGSGTLSNRHL